MTVPLMILAVLAVVSGFIEVPHVFVHEGANWFSHYLSGVIAVPEASHLDASTEFALMGIALGLVILMIIITYVIYVAKKTVPPAEENLSALDKLSYNKFYVDEIYDAVIGKPVALLSSFSSSIIEKQIIDRFVNLSGQAVQLSSKTLRLVQSGNINTYATLMVIGIVVLLLINIVL